MRGGKAQAETRPSVLSCNWNTVTVFLLLTSDWTRHGMSAQFLGIPSPAIQSVLTLCQLALDPEEFEGLKLMEYTAKPILNQALKKK